MKKLILFIHGLGGSDKTWGNFKTFIAKDSSFGGFDVKFYGYRIVKKGLEELNHNRFFKLLYI